MFPFNNVPADYADRIYFAEGSAPGQIVFASTLSLGHSILTATGNFGGSLTLRAEVPEPGTLGIFALSLVGFALSRRKKLSV